MHSISIDLGERSYQVQVGHDILARLGTLAADLRLGRRVAVVADQAVAVHYLAPVRRSLEEAGFDVLSVPFTGGDAAKTLATADAILGELIRAELDRSCWVAALGGGVVGDLAGFVAATYLRGVSFVQLPTSVVAQVDASVGGKTAVNHALGKNLVGAFHQPRLVLADTRALRTLPRRELVGGLGEVIKHAVIRDPELFAFLEARLEDLVDLRVTDDDMDWLIGRNVSIKAAVVAADEREGGLRAILNYGHTVGHAIEAATHYSSYRHGEAVILGMVAAAEIAVQRGLLDPAERQRQDALLRRLELPGDPASLDAERILACTRVDKKRTDGRLRFVLPRRLGAVELVDGVDEQEVRAAIRHVQRMPAWPAHA